MSKIWRVWRYQRGNQNPYIEEEQTTQWPKEKVQKDKQWSTKHTHKTKDRVTRTLHYLVINEGQHGWNCQIKGCVEFVFSVNQNTYIILNILRADCPLHSKYLYHACNRCSVRLYLQLFVGGFMSYLRCLCLLAHSGVQHTLCCGFGLFFFVLWTLCFSGLSIFDSPFGNL